MSTLSERVTKIGEIRDYISSVTIHFDELGADEKAAILDAVDVEIARSYLAELDPSVSNNFSLRRCLVDKWGPEFYIAGVLPEDVDSTDVSRYYTGRMFVSRSLFDSIINYILHKDRQSRLWCVAVPLKCYVEHVRETIGGKYADMLDDVTDAEIERMRKNNRQTRTKLKREMYTIYRAIYSYVLRECYKEGLKAS